MSCGWFHSPGRICLWMMIPAPTNSKQLNAMPDQPRWQGRANKGTKSKSVKVSHLVTTTWI